MSGAGVGSSTEGKFCWALGGSSWAQNVEAPPFNCNRPQAALLCLGSFRQQLGAYSLGETVKRNMGYSRLMLF